jgi:cytochrome c556
MPWLCATLLACGDDGRCRKVMKRIQETDAALCKGLLAADLGSVRQRATEIVELLRSDPVRQFNGEPEFHERREACEQVVGTLASVASVAAAEDAYRHVTAACDGCHDRYRPQ